MHRPSARCPSSMSAWVTMPTGFVKSTIQASFAARRAVSSARSRTTRDGPERLGEAAGAGRLLADDTEAQGQRLVDEAGRLAADSQLEQDEVGAVDGRVAVAGEGQSPRPAQPIEHPRARPPTTSSRSGSMSSRTSSSMGRRSVRRAKPSTSSGVYVLPAADDRDPGAHPPSHPSAGVLTRLLITLSAIDARARPNYRPSIQEEPLRVWPVSVSSSARSRCTTRSISTCVIRLMPARWRPGEQLPTERDLAGTLRLQPDHRPSRARRARPRGSHRADPGARHVRPAPAARSRHRRAGELRRRDAGSAVWIPRRA